MLPPGPDTRVVELRVAGATGVTEEALVSSVAAVDVAGDGVGRFVRPADRLLRPAPGPMLRAEGQSIPRVVEGYSWRALAGGGLARAGWAVLLPFTLADVAHWTLPPVPAGHRLAARLGQVLRALLRLAGVLLTVLLVAQAAVLSLELVAARCLAPGAACLELFGDWPRTTVLVRPLVGLLPVLVLVWLLARAAPAVPADRAPVDQPARAGLPGANLAVDRDLLASRALHLAAGLATLASLPLGGPFVVPAGALVVPWAAAVALLGCTLVGVLLLADPGGAGWWPRLARAAGFRRVLVGTGIVLVLVVAAVRHPLPSTLPGTGATVGAVTGVLVGLVVVVGLLLVPAALIARRDWREWPRELRPWAGGWLAAPVLAVAVLLGGGFGAGLAIVVGSLLDVPVPPGYPALTGLWGASAVLAGFTALVAAGVAAVRLAGRPAGGAAARLLHAENPGDLPAAVRAGRWPGWWHRHAQHVLLTGVGLLTIGAAVVTAAVVVPWLTGRAPAAWTGPLSWLGVVVLAVLAGGLCWPAGRAEPLSGWPRVAHPVGPPPVAAKAVPELAGRVVEHLREPGARVVLVGAGHGGLLAVLTAARLLGSVAEPDRHRIGLLVVGSPLRWAVARAFPAVLPASALGALAGELGTRWRALCRTTDPLGGAVTTWGHEVDDDRLRGHGFRPDGTAGPLPDAVRAPHGALVLGGDHWLPDPAVGPVAGRRWAAGVRRHADYPADPEWDRAVALAAGLDPAEPTLGASRLVFGGR